MKGAIIGDIVGSIYEFSNIKTKEFELFSRDCSFTDDSVMTAAVAQALMDTEAGAYENEIRENLVNSLKYWGRRYPDAGYGGRFSGWLTFDDRQPYNSFGNGSAMRVAAAAWLYDDLFTTRYMAHLTAAVTHNHIEGIRGAEAVASAIFLARTGSGKNSIKEYIEREFSYDLTFTCDEIRTDYTFNETCMNTVPQAIVSFLEGKDFEDVIRTGVSLGGDTDTLCAVAGAVAEAYYGVPPEIWETAGAYLTDDLRQVVDRFYRVLQAERGA